MILDRLAAIEARLTSIEEKTGKTKDVVEAWDAARNAGRFLKWAAAVLASAAAVWAAIKTGLHFDGVGR